MPSARRVGAHAGQPWAHAAQAAPVGRRHQLLPPGAGPQAGAGKPGCRTGQETGGPCSSTREAWRVAHLTCFRHGRVRACRALPRATSLGLSRSHVPACMWHRVPACSQPRRVHRCSPWRCSRARTLPWATLSTLRATSTPPSNTTTKCARGRGRAGQESVKRGWGRHPWQP